jgi:hypothetical protein
MASDYASKFVLIGFYAQNQDAGAPEGRDQFSNVLFNRFDRHIVEAAEAAGLEVSEESRSIMAVLASMSSGVAPKTKATQAVRAYLKYRGKPA